MRNKMIPKGDFKSLPQHQQDEINAKHDMMLADISGEKRFVDAYSALECLMADLEETRKVDLTRFPHANAKLILEKYGPDSLDIIEGIMDDGEKFTQDGESRGSNYQHGGI